MVTSDSVKAKARRDDYKNKVSDRYSTKRKDIDMVSQDFSKTGKQELSRILATEIKDKFGKIERNDALGLVFKRDMKSIFDYLYRQFGVDLAAYKSLYTGKELADKIKEKIKTTIEENEHRELTDDEFMELYKERHRDMLMRAINNFYGEGETSVERSRIQLEKENYRIEKNLDVNQKLAAGWEILPNQQAEINGKSQEISILRKLIPGEKVDAFVYEYMDDGIIPKDLIWQQLFNWNAVLNLWLEQDLPDIDDLKKIGQDNEVFLERYFTPRLAHGYRVSDDQGPKRWPDTWFFHGLWRTSFIWCARKNCFGVSSNHPEVWRVYPMEAYAIRRIKKRVT